MSRSDAQPRVEHVDVVGAVSDRQRAYAVAKIDSLAQYAPIRAARVVVGAAPGGGFSLRVNLSGDRVFAHAEAGGETVYEAVDLARQRLYHQLTRRQHSHHGRVHAPGAQHPGSE